MVEIKDIKFDEKGLVPVIVQEYGTKRVLTLAYMNAETLELSMKEGRTVFWSRSRGVIWRKGETSGNVQRLVSITADCDRDALVAEVIKEGPACHLGTESCFEYPLLTAEESSVFTVDGLYRMLKGRKEHPKEGSYTSYLFDKGMDKILKKIGEEATEVVIAGKDGDSSEAVFEISDLCYHVLVMMAEMGLTPEDVRKELASRHVVDKKVKQEKML